MTLVIRAPFAGWSTPLAEIPDEVFARAMLGEGAAIDPVSPELCAPCDGEVISIAAALHAIALRAAGGAEILIHVGIDTVALGGKGSRCWCARATGYAPAMCCCGSISTRSRARRAACITPVIVTNAERFRIVRTQVDRRLSAGDVLVRDRGAIGRRTVTPVTRPPPRW